MAGQMCKLQLLLLCCCVFVAWQQADANRIAYKKPIFGKTNHIKEKRYKLRTDGTSQLSSTTAATTTTAEAAATTTTTTTTASPTAINMQPTIEGTTEKTSTTQASNSIELNVEATHQLMAVEKPANHSSYTATTIADSAINKIDSFEDSTSSVLPALGSSSTTAISTTSTTSSTTESTPIGTLPSPEIVLPQQVPCTCGVFLSSQLRNGLPENPLIHNELDRMFACNPIGLKQCQTKCLEAIVQHLPNSASIVCGTLGHDCHKERAYLFIKNCQNQWVNTKLQAGREYCCRAGQPYRCPLLG